MEGITGVTSRDHVDPNHPEYASYRVLMTADVNAAIEGAFHAGADEVIVHDGHAGGLNLLLEDLDPRAALDRGNLAPLGMVQGVDRDVSGVCFVGYHASNGSLHAILDHTWSSVVANVWLNEKHVGEIGLNAAVCGHFDVPVIMISGDQTACGEARHLLGDLEVAVIKQAAGRFSAECLPPPVAREKICEAAARAVTRLRMGTAPQPYKPDPPLQIRLEFSQSHQADLAMLLPEANREDGRTISFIKHDALQAYRAFRAAVTLAGK